MDNEEVEMAKPVINEEDTLKNPLLAADFKVKVRRMKDGSFVHVGDGVNMFKEIELEYDTYAKYYNGSDNRQMVSSFSPRAQRLFLWIMAEVEPGKDYLWVNVKRYMKENHIEDMKTYRAAVKELTRYMIIRLMHGYKNVFWVNPQYFFCGNRLNKYPTRIKYVNDGQSAGRQEVQPPVVETIPEPTAPVQAPVPPPVAPVDPPTPQQPSEFRVR